MTDDQVMARVHGIIATCVAGLSDQDVAERIAWCHKHNVHGTRMVPGECETEFHWGGRLLVVVPHAVLTGDEPWCPVFVSEVPDDARGLTE